MIATILKSTLNLSTLHEQIIGSSSQETNMKLSLSNNYFPPYPSTNYMYRKITVNSNLK